MTTSEQQEKLDRLNVLFNEQRLRKQADTFSSRTAAELVQDNQGRWAKDTTIIGSKAAALYPRLPADNPQNQMAVVPPEPPLGIDVNETPIVGEPWEVERSLAEDCSGANRAAVNVTNSVGALGEKSSAPSSDAQPSPGGANSGEPSGSPPFLQSDTSVDRSADVGAGDDGNAPSLLSSPSTFKRRKL